MLIITIIISCMFGIHLTKWQRMNIIAIIRLIFATPSSFLFRLDVVGELGAKILCLDSWPVKIDIIKSSDEVVWLETILQYNNSLIFTSQF